MSYSDKRVFSRVSSLATTTDIPLFAALSQTLMVTRVGVMILTAGSSGVVTVTFQKTVGGNAGTDTTIKALIVSDSLHSPGTTVWGAPSAPVEITPGDHVNLSVPDETSGTATANCIVLVEYFLVDKATADDASLIATA